MARKRKGNSLNKVERLARKGSIKENIIVYSIILLFSLLLVLADDAYNKVLTPGNLTKIELIKTRNDEYNDFILKDLQKRADFYIVLGEDNLLTIYLRFRDEKEYIIFDVITKEEFSTYCKIIIDE